MAVDGGKIRVSTEISTDGIDKGINEVSKKLENLRKKAEEPYELNGVKIKGVWNLSKEEQKYYDRLEATLDKLNIKKAEALIADTKQTQELQKQTKELQTQNSSIKTSRGENRASRIGSLTQELEELVTQYKNMQNQDIVSEQDEEDAKRLKQEIIETAQQLERINGYKIKIKGITETETDINKIKNSFNDVKSAIDKVSKNITGIVKKMAMWGLAIFSIRGAYNLIRSSMTTILQYNDQLNADVQYMRNAIAFSLEPIIVKIVELMKTLMQYVGYIVYSWTGKNIFENANKSLKSANSQANKLRKTLAGFDEMNIMQDTSSSSGGKGTTTPSFNLTNPEDVDAPQWIKWIVANKDGILATLGGIAGFLGAIKLGFGGIKSIGIGAIFGGAVYTIERLLDYFEKLDPELENNGTNWEDLGKIIKGVSLIILGVGIVSGQVYVAIAGLVLLLASIIMENWEKIKQWWNTKVKPKIDAVQTWLEQKLGIFGKIISGTIEEVKRFIVTHFSGILIPVKNIFDGILLFLKGDWKKGIENIVKGIINFIIGRINKLIDGLNTFLIPFRAILVEISNLTGKKTSMSKFRIPNIPYLAKGGIINLPNKGVMVGSAIAGESGKEGVLPLTDTQAMQQLGEMIGRYITINANITNTMNGRVISRELQKINNENNFAFNR